MFSFPGLLGHIKSKHPEYMDKFEQKKAEIMKIRAERRSGTLDTFKIGEAKPEFNLTEPVLFSHNYFRREKTTSEVAECLMCQTQTFIRTRDGNTKVLVSHLQSKHFQYLEQFELKKAEVLKRRTERTLKRKSSKNEI